MSTTEGANTTEPVVNPRIDDFQPRLVSGPEDYAYLTEGPVEYIAVGDATGILGYLWAADADGAAGYQARGDRGDLAHNAGIPWAAKLRELKAQGLTPSQALARLATLPAPQDAGAVVPGSDGRADSLVALRQLAATQ
ncbi:MAG: hypothetical protein ACRCSN_17670 [Dermatophilaceae bacterium]